MGRRQEEVGDKRGSNLSFQRCLQVRTKTTDAGSRVDKHKTYKDKGWAIFGNLCGGFAADDGGTRVNEIKQQLAGASDRCFYSLSRSEARLTKRLRRQLCQMQMQLCSIGGVGSRLRVDTGRVGSVVSVVVYGKTSLQCVLAGDGESKSELD